MVSLYLQKEGTKQRLVLAILGIAASVALPQVFHAIGVLSGTGANLGIALLPMHLPVLITALMGGPVIGILAGIASPIVSTMLFGMPAPAMMPLMVIELAGYGLVGGFVSKVKLPLFVKLVIAQLGGRAIRGIAIIFMIYALGSQTLQLSSIWMVFVSGLPGIILQWAIVPNLLYRVQDTKKDL